MTSATYKKQAGLLLEILPEVAKEECFAMHGGTAINLFVRDMPRLSVDIDLTYLPVFSPPSCSFNIPIICSSLNRFFIVVCSFSLNYRKLQTLTQLGLIYGVQVTGLVRKLQDS